MKYRNRYCYVLILCILTLSVGFSVFCEESEYKKIKDVLDLNTKMEIEITEVYYRKQETQKLEIDQEMSISIEQLRKLFLEKAVVVSGETINYAFGYETVIISGLIKNNKKSYQFDYNLAGFGTIFIKDKKFVLYGDMSKSIPEQ